MEMFQISQRDMPASVFGMPPHQDGGGDIQRESYGG